jgi:hypothetical protein
MAKMPSCDAVQKCKERGFVRMMEPAVGAGGMVIATAEALVDEGINYQQAMHATCIDVDAAAVHMAYLQLSLLHIPAIIIHGNALTREQWSYWVTPAHVLGLWNAKLKRDAGAGQEQAKKADHAVPAMNEAIKQQVREVAAVRAGTGQLTLF